MNRLWLVPLAALVACDSTTEDNGGVGAPCVEDFDCNVGLVCDVAAGATDGACKTAAAGEERTFGEATLDFTAGTETYLLTVYSLPTGEAASSDLSPFSLAPAAPAEGGALRLRRGTVAPERTSIQDARSRFEVSRRAQIDALIEEMQAGRVLESPARQANACSPACGADTMCVDGTCTSTLSLRLTAGGPMVDFEVATVVDGLINVLVEEGESTTEAEAAAEAFSTTFARELQLLGLDDHGGSVADRDGDGRFTVAFTNSTSAAADLDNVGFFDLGDFLEEGTSGATGNEMDVLWVRVPGSTIGGNEFTENYAVGTMAHEYAHLVGFAVRVWGKQQNPMREVLWLDEGIAHTMEDLTGWGPSTVPNVAAALGGFGDSPFAGPTDGDEQRGKAYLLLRHVIEENAGAASNAAASQIRTTTLISTLINEEALGWEHSVFQGLGADGVANWLLAVFATNNPEVTQSAAHAHDYLDVAPDPTTTNLTGIDPFASLGSTPMVDMRGDEVSLEGPEFEEVSDLTTAVESEVVGSGAIYYVVTGGTGTVTLRGSGDAQADLRVKAVRIK